MLNDLGCLSAVWLVASLLNLILRLQVGGSRVAFAGTPTTSASPHRNLMMRFSLTIGRPWTTPKSTCILWLWPRLDVSTSVDSALASV